MVKYLIKNDPESLYILYGDREFKLNFSGNYKKVIYSFPLDIQPLKGLYFHIMTIFFPYKNQKIYISTHNLFVSFFRKSTILVIHDLTPFLFPSFHRYKIRLIFNILFKRAIINSKVLVTISNSTKNDLLKFFGKFIDEKKVNVIKESIDSDLVEYTNKKHYDPIYWKKIKKIYHINGKYLLFVGTIEPRKNLDTLIKSFEMLINKGNNKIKLVIVGKRGWKYRKLIRYINKLDIKVKSKIIFTGYINNKDKSYLYKNSLLFIYPTLYEGFGLPVLESMSIGSPVITSDNSSIPEVSSNSCIKINPYDKNDIYKAIVYLIKNSNVRNELIQKGFIESKKFDWDNLSKEFIDLYKAF